MALDIRDLGRGSTLALVDVRIGGEGPYTFVLDTGASLSVVSPPLADELGLPRQGSAGGGSRLVSLESWRVGEVALPATTAVATSLPGGLPDVELQGLLGSDVLSAFDYVTIDYDEGRLELGPETS